MSLHDKGAGFIRSLRPCRMLWDVLAHYGTLSEEVREVALLYVETVDFAHTFEDGRTVSRALGLLDPLVVFVDKAHQ